MPVRSSVPMSRHQGRHGAGLQSAADPGPEHHRRLRAYVQDRRWQWHPNLADQAAKLVAAASKRPELTAVRTTFDASVPQYNADLDREKAKALGVPIDTRSSMPCRRRSAASMSTTSRSMAAITRSSCSRRRVPPVADDLRQVFVRSDSGSMIPLDTLVKVDRIIGPDQVERFNAFNSAKVTGNPAPATPRAMPSRPAGSRGAALPPTTRSPGQARPTRNWPPAARATQAMLFGIIMVFLILAAQYEKWTLPLAVITAIPFALFGALLATGCVA
jgi:multidrug efflux pump